MGEQFKFLLGRILVAPLMPIVFYQGNRIRRKFPRLPEAKEPTGESGADYHDKISIVGLGESTMAGVGIDLHKNALLGQFSDHLSRLTRKKISWQVYAKSGLTAEQTRRQILPQINEKKVDLFVISLGGNDTFQLNSPKEWAQQITLLIEELRVDFPKAPILFTTMPPVHTFPAFTGSIRFVLGRLIQMHGRQLNQIIERFENVYFDAETIDLDVWLKNLPQHKKEDFYSDGVHPSALTFSIWAKELAQIAYKELHND